MDGETPGREWTPEQRHALLSVYKLLLELAKEGNEPPAPDPPQAESDADGDEK